LCLFSNITFPIPPQNISLFLCCLLLSLHHPPSVLYLTRERKISDHSRYTTFIEYINSRLAQKKKSFYDATAAAALFLGASPSVLQANKTSPMHHSRDIRTIFFRRCSPKY